MKRGLKYYHSFYTNIQSTMNAMSSYFYMDSRYGHEIFNHLPEIEKQKIIAGANPVLRTFEKNNYVTNIVILLNKQMANDYCFATRCFLADEKIPLLPGHFQLFDRVVLNSLFTPQYYHMFTPHHISANEKEQYILKKLTRSSHKHFTYIHSYNPGHAHMSFTDGKGVCNEQIELQNYKQRITQTNDLIINMLDTIITNDHNAIIILASDHGPFIFNRCSTGARLSTKEEVIERQGVLLAIKWGEGYDGRFDKDIKSSANLFRYIFSYLTANNDLLKNKPADDAFYMHKNEVHQSIADGVILPSPASLTREDN